MASSFRALTQRFVFVHLHFYSGACYFHVWPNFLWTASQWAVWEASFTHTTGFGGKNRGFACCVQPSSAGGREWMTAAPEQNSSRRAENSSTHAEMMTFCHMSEEHTHTCLPAYWWTPFKLFFNLCWSMLLFKVNGLVYRKVHSKLLLCVWTFQSAQQQFVQ